MLHPRRDRESDVSFSIHLWVEQSDSATWRGKVTDGRYDHWFDCGDSLLDFVGSRLHAQHGIFLPLRRSGSAKSIEEIRSELRLLPPEKLAELWRRMRVLRLGEAEVRDRATAPQAEPSLRRAAVEEPQLARPFHALADVDVRGLSDRAVESMLGQLMESPPSASRPTTIVTGETTALTSNVMSNSEVDAVLEQMIEASSPDTAQSSCARQGDFVQ